MSNKEYKKSYRGFVVFFITFLALIIGGALLSAEFFADHTCRIVIDLVCICMAALTFIIYKYDKIYWYNGIEFEEGEKAGKERRDAYTKAHFRIFSIYALCVLAFSTINVLLSVNQWVDFAVGTVGLCTAAIFTVKIKL